MQKILMVVCWAIAVVCGIYGMMVFGLGSGTGFFVVWFAIAIVFAGLGLSFLFRLWEKVPRSIVGVLVVLVVLGAVIFGTVEFMIAGQMHEAGRRGLDYVIVLGAQVRENGPSAILKYRLDRAVDYLNENPETICIVSGGQGENEPFPEAEGMAAYLLEQGIPEERLIQENQSKTTEENIRNSMEYIEESATVGVITNDFHVFRAMQIAEDQNLPDACGIAAGSPRLYLPNNMLREFFAEIKYLLGTGNFSKFPVPNFTLSDRCL